MLDRCPYCGKILNKYKPYKTYKYDDIENLYSLATRFGSFDYICVHNGLTRAFIKAYTIDIFAFEAPGNGLINIYLRKDFEQ